MNRRTNFIRMNLEMLYLFVILTSFCPCSFRIYLSDFSPGTNAHTLRVLNVRGKIEFYIFYIYIWAYITNNTFSLFLALRREINKAAARFIFARFVFTTAPSHSLQAITTYFTYAVYTYIWYTKSTRIHFTQHPDLFSLGLCKCA